MSDFCCTFAAEMKELVAQIEDLDISNPVWETLTLKERAELCRNARVIEYERNEVIFTDGEAPLYVYMVLAGKVRLHKEGVGQKQILDLLKPYDIVGHRAIFAAEPFSAECTAFEDCSVLAINKDYFQSLIESNIHLCHIFLHHLSKSLAIITNQTVNLTQKHIRGRLSESLLTLLKHYGVDEDGATLSIYLSREDLANMSNMTTSNAIRTLSQFSQEGLIGVDGRKIRILDEPGLRKVSRLG